MNFGKVGAIFRAFEEPKTRNHQYKNIRFKWSKLSFEDYQDVVSKVKVRVLTNMRRGRETRISIGYIITCINNELIDRYRKSKIQEQLEMTRLKPLEEYVQMPELRLKPREVHNLNSLHKFLMAKGLTELEAALMIGRLALGAKYDILAEELNLSEIDARLIVKNTLRRLRRKRKYPIKNKKSSIEDLIKLKNKNESE